MKEVVVRKQGLRQVLQVRFMLLAHKDIGRCERCGELDLMKAEVNTAKYHALDLKTEFNEARDAFRSKKKVEHKEKAKDHSTALHGCMAAQHDTARHCEAQHCTALTPAQHCKRWHSAVRLLCITMRCTV